MISLNRVTLFGNVGRDPEVHETSAGRRIVTFTLATNESWKAKDGTKKGRTEWHRIVIFHPGIADVAESLLKRGSCVYIEGTLRTRAWTDVNGVERMTTEVVVDYGGNIIIPNSSDAPAGDGTRSGAGTPKQTLSEELDDEIPF